MHSISTFRFLTTGRALQEITANYTDFACFAHSSRELHKIRTRYGMTRNPRVNPVNPRKLQRITQIPHHSHPTAGKLRKFAIFAHQSYVPFFCYNYAPCYSTYTLTHTYLHIPRLVSHYYVCSEKPVFLKCQLCHFRTITLIIHKFISGPLHSLTTTNALKQKSHRCRYMGIIQYCQLIALNSNV